MQGVAGQIATGKCYILADKDRRGRTVVVVHVKHHDPKQQTVDELTRFGVHVLLSAEAALTRPPNLGPPTYPPPASASAFSSSSSFSSRHS